MGNSNFDFFKMAFFMGAIDTDYLQQVVKTEKNQFGYITSDQYKEICGQEFVE